MPSTPSDATPRGEAEAGRPRLRLAHLLTVVALALFLLVPAWARADEKGDDKKKGSDAASKDTDEKKPADPAKKDEPKGIARKPILPIEPRKMKEYRPLVDAARLYFDLDEEQWKGRTALVGELERHAAEGRFFLKDMDALRWMVYEGRSFDPPFNDRKWQKAFGLSEAKSLAGTLGWVKSDELTAVYSVPKKYWKPKDFRGKFPRPQPYPLLVPMHEKRDYTNQKYAGEVLLKRRYPKKEWSELYEKWLIFAPVAAAGNFLSKTGTVRRKVFQDPFSIFWRHYHVDFDRIVLDGSEQAFTVASSLPVFFSGVIFNGKWTLKTDEQKELIKNLAPVPVYVVKNPKLAQQLRDGGHKQVTAGVGGKTLMTWMNARKRVLPKKFTWIVQKGRYDQVLPYWINIDTPNMSAPKRQIEVEILDETNTVSIKAEGIVTLSLFLNDDLVDLDRKVRVEINGHVEYDDKVPLQDPRMEKIGRDFDFLFNREPVRIRESMFLGWLAPARVVSLNVRDPRKVAPKKDDKKDTGPKASKDDIDRAARLLEKAKVFHKRGNFGAAKRQLDKILELPETPHHGEARELKKKVDEALDKGEKK